MCPTCQQTDNSRLITTDIIHLNIKVRDNFNFDLIGVYRFHEFSVNVFTEEFDKYLNQVENVNLIISGDLNIDTLKKTQFVENYKINMVSRGLTSLINDPTRTTADQSSCIDHVYFRHSVKCVVEYKSWVTDMGVTDHRMTAVCIKRESGRAY